MKTWASFLPDVLPHVPGCPDAIAVHELRRSAQQFFRLSRAWRMDLDPIFVAADQASYTLDQFGLDVEIMRIESATLDGIELDPTTVEEVSQSYGSDHRIQTGFPTHYYQLSPEQITLYRKPLVDSVDGLVLRASVVPSDASAGLPDEIASKYRDPIFIGARSRLMLYPDAAWTKPDLAVAYGQAFQSFVERANHEASRGFVQARLRARPKWV